MTSRERWTVYPLLFLALGMGLRNHQMDVMQYKAFQCETLEIVSKKGEVVAMLSSTANQHGLLQLADENKHVTAQFGPNGLQVTDAKKNTTAILNGAGLQLADRSNYVTAALSTFESAGNLRLMGPDKQSAVNIGFERPQAGMVVEMPANNVVRIPVLVNVPIKPPASPASETETPQDNTAEKDKPEPE
jgi:hypothetical protein